MGRSVPVSGQSAPAYTPEEAALFNDMFDPEVFGLPSTRGTQPDRQQKLTETLRRSDTIQRVRVITVSRFAASEGEPAYSVVLQPVGQPIQGFPLDGPIGVTISASSPAFTWLDAVRERWIGERLILMVRYYGQNGIVTVHFHAAAENPSVKDTIRGALGPDSVQ